MYRFAQSKSKNRSLNFFVLLQLFGMNKQICHALYPSLSLTNTHTHTNTHEHTHTQHAHTLLLFCLPQSLKKNFPTFKGDPFKFKFNPLFILKLLNTLRCSFKIRDHYKIILLSQLGHSQNEFTGDFN